MILWFEFYVFDLVMLGGYGFVDLVVGYVWEEVKFMVYVINLFDKEYFIYDYGLGVMVILGDCCEVGICLDYQF